MFTDSVLFKRKYWFRSVTRLNSQQNIWNCTQGSTFKALIRLSSKFAEGRTLYHGPNNRMLFSYKNQSLITLNQLGFWKKFSPSVSILSRSLKLTYCYVISWNSNREEKSLRHVVMVAKFLDLKRGPANMAEKTKKIKPMTFLWMIALMNKTVTQTVLTSFDNANGCPY